MDQEKLQEELEEERIKRMKTEQELKETKRKFMLVNMMRRKDAEVQKMSKDLHEQYPWIPDDLWSVIAPESDAQAERGKRSLLEMLDYKQEMLNRSMGTLRRRMDPALVEIAEQMAAGTYVPETTIQDPRKEHWDAMRMEVNKKKFMEHQGHAQKEKEERQKLAEKYAEKLVAQKQLVEVMVKIQVAEKQNRFDIQVTGINKKIKNLGIQPRHFKPLPEYMRSKEETLPAKMQEFIKKREEKFKKSIEKLRKKKGRARRKDKQIAFLQKKGLGFEFKELKPKRK